MSSWREDAELVRQDDEDDLQTIEVEQRWANLFAMVEKIFVPGGGGLVSGAQRALFRPTSLRNSPDVAESSSLT